MRIGLEGIMEHRWFTGDQPSNFWRLVKQKE